MDYQGGGVIQRWSLLGNQEPAVDFNPRTKRQA
jgi:hypothetical protein